MEKQEGQWLLKEFICAMNSKEQAFMPNLRSLLCIAGALIILNNTSAQSVAINTDGSTADATAILDVKSTGKGMLIPRMTTVQRTAIATPATGLLAFDTDTNAFWFYNGTAWTKLEASGNNWSITGNTNTTAGTHFMGTTDAVDIVLKSANTERMRLLSAANTQNTIATISTGDLQVNDITVGRGNSNVATNTANGYQALYANTTGNSNTANGYGSLASNTIGFANTANGYGSLYSNTIGLYNTANGYRSLYFNTTGNYNTANGYMSLFSNNGADNTANGYQTLYSNTTGNFNTANGYQSLNSNTTGYANTAYGYSSLSLNTTGNYNTALGYYANVSTGNLTNVIAIGYGVIVNASNKVVIGNASVTVIGGPVGWSTLSDGRFKSNIKKDVPGLDFIMQLNPVNYNFMPRKFEEHLRQNMPDSVKKNAVQRADEFSEAEKIQHTGFIAQEVEQVVIKNGYKFNGVHAPVNATDNYSITYDEFVVPLVKAVQEQQQQIEQQKKIINEQQKMLSALKKRLDRLEQQ